MCLIVADSMFESNRSNAVELLTRFKDHATGAFYKGFRMLIVIWSNSHTFLSRDFALFSSRQAQVSGLNEKFDKRNPAINVVKRRFSQLADFMLRKLS